MKLGTPEHMLEVVKRTNSDAKYLRLSKDQKEIYSIVLEAEPEKGVNEALTICYRVESGKTVEVFPAEREATFRISAPYGIWVDILGGKLGVNRR